MSESHLTLFRMDIFGAAQGSDGRQGGGGGQKGLPSLKSVAQILH